jgi:hypothetical protein
VLGIIEFAALQGRVDIKFVNSMIIDIIEILRVKFPSCSSNYEKVKTKPHYRNNRCEI